MKETTALQDRALSPDDLETKKQSQIRIIWRQFRKNKRAVFGLVLLVIVLSTALFAGVIAPYSASTQDISVRLQTPSMSHLFGTDEYGRDIFSRVVYGARISLLVGFASVLSAALIGGFMGALAGYYGGTVELVIMRCTDVLMSIPAMLLNISIAAALGQGVGNTIIALSISTIPTYCRLMRSSILSVRGQEYIEASRSVGAKDGFIIGNHIVPNCLAPMMVQMTLGVGHSIIMCSALSYIGLGVSPPKPEWGAMLAASRDYLRDFPHMTLFPGLAIMVTVFALNLMGDGLRDALDPKLRS